MAKETKKYQTESCGFNMLCPQADAEGNLQVKKCDFRVGEITIEAARKIGHLILCGLRLGVDTYLPTYAPDEILMVTNEESMEEKDDKCAVLVQDNRLVIARRAVEGGRVGFRSIRSTHFYVKDERTYILGYVAGTLRESEVKIC